jgi:actin-like ATPase involved in cell morphogenesis
VLNKMIDQTLADQQIEKNNLKISEQEIDKTIERIKESRSYTDVDLRAGLAEQGLTVEEYRENLEKQLLRGKLVNLEVKSKIVITSEEIREALREPIAAIIDAVTRTLERAEPELAADLIENGLHICGGGSLLRGMDTVLANATGLGVERVDDPLSAVARGTSVYLENLELWKDTMDHSEYGWS